MKTSLIQKLKIRPKHSGMKSFSSGMTLIEVTIYSALLSFVIFGFVNFSYQIYFDNLKLNSEIEDAYLIS